MSDTYLYSCKHCHVVLADPNICPGDDCTCGCELIEAWCPICNGWQEMWRLHPVEVAV